MDAPTPATRKFPLFGIEPATPATLDELPQFVKEQVSDSSEANDAFRPLGYQPLERSDRQRLMAKPACPAPITIVVTVRIGGRSHSSAAMACGVSIHYDRNIRRVRQHVIDCRSLLRLRNESVDVFTFRIGVNFL